MLQLLVEFIQWGDERGKGKCRVLIPSLLSCELFRGYLSLNQCSLLLSRESSLYDFIFPDFLALPSSDNSPTIFSSGVTSLFFVASLYSAHTLVNILNPNPSSNYPNLPCAFFSLVGPSSKE